MRRVLPLVLLLIALPLVGCGGKEPDRLSAADEGLYVDAGGLKYQVQGSRVLNPSLNYDRQLIRDLPAGTRPPVKGQVWFGIWLRVENESRTVHQSAGQFELEDTQGQIYHNIPVSSANILAYQPTALAPDNTIPHRDTATAESGPREGAFLLFKLNDTVYQNRPIDLHIVSNALPPKPVASIQIDL